jgi:hypothetical protein
VVFEFMRKGGVPPNHASLKALVSKARDVRVFAGGATADRLLGDQLLFSSGEAGSITKLGRAMRIVDGLQDHCMCCGHPTIEWLGAAGDRLALISIHHGRSIRWRGWQTDAELVEGRCLLEWLVKLGVTEPLASVEEQERESEAGECRWVRWLKAAPPCLRRRLASELHDFSAMQLAIEKDYPVNLERALVLFEWFEDGNGPWSPSPVYEDAARTLLMTIPLADLLAAAGVLPSSPSRGEGAARPFASWEVYRKQPAVAPLQMPEALKQTLLDHGLQFSDADKRARAKRAYGPQ